MSFRKLVSCFDHWVATEYRSDLQSLAIVRILVAYNLWSGLQVERFPFGEVYPQALFQPPIGVTALFSGWPHPALFQCMMVILVLSTTMLLLGYRTQAASILTGLLFLLFQNWRFSMGKISHTVLFDILPLALAFSGWGRCYSLDSLTKKVAHRGPAPAWPIAVLALCIGTGFFLAGLPKLGWLAGDTQATKYFVMSLATSTSVAFGKTALRLLPDFVWELGDYATVAFEVGFLAAVLKRGVFQIFCLAAMVFHMVVYLLLGISFSSTLFAYLVFFPIAHCIPKIKLTNYRRAMLLMNFALCLTLLTVGLMRAVFGYHVWIPHLAGHIHLMVAGITSAGALVWLLTRGLTRLVSKKPDTKRTTNTSNTFIFSDKAPKPPETSC